METQLDASRTKILTKVRIIVEENTALYNYTKYMGMHVGEDYLSFTQLQSPHFCGATGQGTWIMRNWEWWTVPWYGFLTNKWAVNAESKKVQCLWSCVILHRVVYKVNQILDLIWALFGVKCNPWYVKYAKGNCFKEKERIRKVSFNTQWGVLSLDE